MVALERYQVIRPFLDQDTFQTELARTEGIAVRTVRRWIERYRKFGLAGLARKARRDKATRRLSTSLAEAIEGLALGKPCPSLATVHRKAILAAERLGEPPPSYAQVRAVVRGLSPGLLVLAHEGSKAYCDTFDLLYRREAERPNAIWQADHTEVDVLVKDDKGEPRKPWLTVVLDDYSRAVAGYLLFFGTPSAIQTALALRQAIWRKSQPGWHICGIPQILYTDHGSDFTSRHLEQVSADLKIGLVFSTGGKPRGRGKIERFFKSLSQVLLSRLPGYSPSGSRPATAVLTLGELANEIELYLQNEYHRTPHSETGVPPQERWEAGGFLPQMPESLEQLDLLLLTVPKARRIHQDGIRFMGMRYIDPTLAAYVGEEVLLRYDPRDMAEIRVFYHDRFLCRAVCQELAGATVTLREIKGARDRQRRELRQTLDERRRTVDALLEVRRWSSAREEDQPSAQPAPQPIKLKRYLND